MNKKLILNIIELLLSLFALYTFIFIAELGMFWKVGLIMVSLFWIITAISNIIKEIKN